MPVHIFLLLPELLSGIDCFRRTGTRRSPASPRPEGGVLQPQRSGQGGCPSARLALGAGTELRELWMGRVLAGLGWQVDVSSLRFLALL